MEKTTLEEPTTVKRETFDLSSGLSQPVKLSYELELYGAAADQIRAVRSFVSSSDFDEAIRIGYQDEYGAATIFSSSRVQDDLQENRVIVGMELELPDAYEEDSERARTNFRFRADAIVAPVPVVDEVDRQYPLQLLFKEHIRHEILLLLPTRDWRFDYEVEEIENDAFRFTWEHIPGDLRLRMISELDILADDIAPGAIAGAIEDQNRMLETISRYVWMSTPPKLEIESPELDAGGIEIEIERPVLTPQELEIAN